MILGILILSVIGFSGSLYLFIVEQKIKQNQLYKASCDISDRLSCSKTILSDYANIFFIPNSVLGILFYSLIFILSIKDRANLIFYLSIPSVLTSLYLAWVSYFKIKAFCPVCSIIYIINFLILILGYLNF